MVLESILNPKNAEDKPWHIFVIAFIYTFIGVFFAHQLFPNQSSTLAVAIITILFIPFFENLFELEEEKDDAAVKGGKKQNIFGRHKQAISVFSSFFMGIIVAMTFIFIFMPTVNVFTLQAQTIEGFSGRVVSDTTGAVVDQGDFTRFFVNNTGVMILIFVMSLMLGAGAIFVLVWNASVIAVYVGLIVKSLASNGLNLTTAYLYGVPVGLGSIALHGIPEIAAYFVAGISGGILGVGVIREKLNSKEFHFIFKDSLVFLAIAEILIIAAAFIEAAI
ncbi:MAG: stage II sporulation protein M [Candidatus Aenigmarchaeota archaeon]|nr:stage II sporulation protein M [Candidatus Aenigmarchaeota archaeon]